MLCLLITCSCNGIGAWFHWFLFPAAKLGKIPVDLLVLLSISFFFALAANGKFFRKPISRISRKQCSTSAPFQFIHSDVFGSFPLWSTRGKCYFVTFLNVSPEYTLLTFPRRVMFWVLSTVLCWGTKLHGADVTKLLFGHLNAVQSLRINDDGSTGHVLLITMPDTPSHNSSAEHLGGVLQQAANLKLSSWLRILGYHFLTGLWRWTVHVPTSPEIA